MKRRLIITMFAVLVTTLLSAQEHDRDRIQDQDRTKLVMVNGEMLELRDRAEMRLMENQTLSDGTVVHPDGTYQTRDGKRLRLQDGECLDGDGVKYRNENQYRHKVNQENKGLTESKIQERNQNRVQYSQVDGKMYLIRNQEQNRLQKQLVIGNGVVVNPDGSYKGKDGKQLQLKDGECLNMEGQMFKNTHQHRKMLVQKKMMNKKGVKKPNVQKKKGKKSSK